MRERERERESVVSEAAFSVSMAWAMVESTSVLATSHLFKVVDFNCLIFIYFFLFYTIIYIERIEYGNLRGEPPRFRNVDQ